MTAILRPQPLDTQYGYHPMAYLDRSKIHSCLWAGDLATDSPSDGDPVTTLDNLTGRGSPIQGGATKRAIFRASVPQIGGGPALEFDGVDDNYVLSAFTQAPNYANASGGRVSVLAICYPRSAGRITDGHIDYSSVRNIIAVGADNYWYFAGNSRFGTRPVEFYSPTLIIGEFSGASNDGGRLIINDTVDTTTTAGAHELVGLTVGANGGGGGADFFDGYISTLIIYEGQLETDPGWWKWKRATHSEFGIKGLRNMGPLNDTFTNIDETDLDAHTPDRDPSGNGWTIHVGTWKIRGNALLNDTASSTTAASSIDAQTNRATVRTYMRNTRQGADSRWQGLTALGNAAGDLIYTRPTGSSGTYDWVIGTWDASWSQTVTGKKQMVSQAYHWTEFKVDGNTGLAELYIGGVKQWSVTIPSDVLATYGQNTRWGVYARGGAVSPWDDFDVVPFPDRPAPLETQYDTFPGQLLLHDQLFNDSGGSVDGRAPDPMSGGGLAWVGNGTLIQPRGLTDSTGTNKMNHIPTGLTENLWVRHIQQLTASNSRVSRNHGIGVLNGPAVNRWCMGFRLRSDDDILPATGIVSFIMEDRTSTASVVTPFADGRTYNSGDIVTLELQFSGNQMKCFVDGDLIVVRNFTDAELSAIRANGGTGVGTTLHYGGAGTMTDFWAGTL